MSESHCSPSCLSSISSASFFKSIRFVTILDANILKNDDKEKSNIAIAIQGQVYDNGSVDTTLP